MGPSDLANAPLAALFSTLAFLILLYRWPAGAIFYGATVNGIGGLVQIGPIKYYYVIAGLQAFGCLWLFWRGFRCSLPPLGKRPFEGPLRWLLLGPALLWFRIAIDLIIFHADEFQLVSIKLGICQAILPTFLLLFAIRRLPLATFREHISWGTLLQGAAYVVPALPGLIQRGALNSTQFGEVRLTLYAQDTISAAYFMFLMSCGLILLIQRKEVTVRVKALLGVTLVGVVALLFLNGTRQYLGAAVVFIVLIWMGSLRQKILFVLGVGGIIGVIGVLIMQSMAHTEAAWRLSSGGLREEMYNSRGKIWADAFNSGRANFLQGVGFRQFGEVLIRHEETGELYDYRDEAHGVFQNVIAEQGYMLGGVMVGMFVTAMVAIFRNGWLVGRDEDYRLIFAVTITLMVPLFFSGTPINAVSFYLFFITAAAYSTKRVQVSRRFAPALKHSLAR